MKLKAIVIKPGKFAQVKDINPTYSALRSLVGGNIAMTYPFEDEYLAVISNEESKLLDLPPNRAIRRADGSVIDIYCGTMVVVALATEGEYRDLTKREAKAILQMWGPPEDRGTWGGAKPNMAISVFAASEAAEMLGGVFA